MKKLTGGLFLPAVVVALSVSLFKFQALAVPYASGVTNDGAGTIYFILNERADEVTVTRNVGPINLGVLEKGTHSFALDGATSYEIVVMNDGGPGYRTGATNQISTDTNLARFFSPRGVAVNRNPASPQFGRIYIANSTSGTTTIDSRPLGRGIYMLNADFTDALGLGDTPSTADITFATSANSPYRLSVGQDNNLYIADFSDANGNLFVADGNMSAGSGSNVFTLNTGMALVPVGTEDNHGSLYAAVTIGSLGGNDLTVYTLDEDLQPDREQTTTNMVNSVWRYSVNGGPLPFTDFDASYKLFTPQVATVAQNMDLDRGPDGKLYLYQNRSANQTQPNLYVLNANGNLLADSRTLSLAISGVTNDLLAVTTFGHLAVSPDGKFLALLANNNRVYIVRLTNGIPSLSNPLVSFGAGGTTASARDVSFDAANNLYIVSSGLQILRAFSPGGITVARTSSDGIFSVDVPASEVSVAATIATANEQGPVNGQFTVSRIGDPSAALTVNYAITGIASNGVDYTMLSTNVTFAPGATSTNITVAPIDDSVAELTETVILSILSSTNYNLGASVSATVSILDNESPELSITAVQPRLLECFAKGKATFRITRKGLLTPGMTANLSYAPASGTDFNGPATVAIAPGIANTNFNITPIEDSSFEGNETVTISVAAGWVIPWEHRALLTAP